MTNRQFKLHIASLLHRQRVEEAAAERASITPAPARKRATAKKAASTEPAATPGAVYEPKIHFRIKRSKHR